MRILGIDPGYAIVGTGIVDFNGNNFSVADHYAITTAAGTQFSHRLQIIFNETTVLIDEYRPDCVAIEELFFTTNQKTGIAVAEARGVLLLAARLMNVPVFEYTPLQVKQAVTGYGKAPKAQMQEMTRVLLSLARVPKPDDVADALAIAICHAHCSRGRNTIMKQV